MRPLRIGDAVFFAACAFMGGMFVADERWPFWPIFGAVAVFAAAGFVFKTKAAAIVASAAVVVGAGYGYCRAYASWQAAHTRLPSGNQQFLGVVSDEPHPTGKFLMVPIRLSSPYEGAITVFASERSSVQYGDLVWVKGSVTPSATGGDESPAVFYPQIRTIAQGQGLWWKERLAAFRAAIARAFARVFAPDEAALLTAILLGSTGAVAGALKTQMDASGTTYIVGMYGYKMIILIASVRWAIEGKVPRWWTFGIAAGVVILFVAVSGAGVSVFRAAIMGLMTLSARAFGRVFSARQALVFAALLIAVGSPGALVDAGFQLSFLSYLGIFYLRGPVNTLFHWKDPGFLQWKEHAMLSLTTNLAILPIALGAFGDFSLTSFVSNVFIMIPWVPVLLGGMLAACLALIGPLFAFPIVAVLKVLLSYELFVIRTCSRVVLPLPAIFGSGIGMAVYYASLIIVAYYHAARPKEDR